MTSFANELRQVLRRLARAPMFASVTLLTLAVGIGANTVVFSVLEGVLLKPLPYPADELVGVWLTAPGINLKDTEISPSDYFIFREQGRAFQDVGHATVPLWQRSMSGKSKRAMPIARWQWPESRWPT